MKDLLLKFSELQVTVAQLANQAQNGVLGGGQGPPFVRRNSFGNGMRPPATPQTPGQNQSPNAGRWNAPRRDVPPHESNSAGYESTYYSNYTGTGANAIPVNTGSAHNQWGNRASGTASGGQDPVNGNQASAPGPSNSVKGPFTPNGGSFAPRPPLCLWCAGEDGDPHWMYACPDLTKAINDGIVRRDNENKIRYGSRFIPGRGHPRGMRAWVREQEELARTEIREANERSKERVRFGKEVQVNSIEYDPPEIEDHTEYESGHVRVDEYEVNQTKRPRSGTSTDVPPPKIRTPRAQRPLDNLFEDLGGPRVSKPDDRDKDTEMRDVPRKRAPTVAKPKLESAVESKSDPRAFLEKILEQPITVPMSVMLANSPELAKLLVAECRRKRSPQNDPETNHLGWEAQEGDEPQVNLHSYDGGKKPYYAGVLAFANITVEGEVIKALLDNGSMICMMQDEVRRRLGLPIRTDGSHRVRMAGGGLETLMGISENVPVRIGGVTTHVHFFISKGSSNPILLGQNFLRQIEARFSYHADGSVMMGMTYKGRRITVEVTSKDESRYLSKVPGESGEYDSAMVAMMGQEPDDRRVGPFCTWCGPVHQVNYNTRNKNPCTGQHVHPARITMPSTQSESTDPQHGTIPKHGTRSQQRELKRSDAFANFTTSQFGGEVCAGPSLYNTLPTEIQENPHPEGEVAAKRRRSRRRGRPFLPLGMDPMENQMEVDRTGSSNITVTIHHMETSEPNRPEIVGTPTGIRVKLPYYEPSAEEIENCQRTVIAAAAELAISNERERQQALKRQLGTKTEPWIQSCTDEEARARAHELREEYDSFLEVLFGRRIRLEKKLRHGVPEHMANEATSELTEGNTPPDAQPSPEYPPAAPRRERECSSMMFPLRTLRKYKSIDMAAFTHQYRTIGEEEEADDTAASTTGEASESLPYELGDWVDEAKMDDPEVEDPDRAYQRLCEESSPPPMEIATTPKTEEVRLASELGILADQEVPTLSGPLKDDLITELGLRIEGCVFTANLVELVNPEESFAMDEDWPTPGDEEGSEGSDFDMDDDFYYSMLEGIKHISFTSEDGTSDMEDEPEGSRATEAAELSDEPIFVEGKWRTFELDSEMSEDEESEGAQIVRRMIQNSRDRRERLIKVAKAQIDLHRAHEYEVTQGLSGSQGDSYDANMVNLETGKDEAVAPAKLELVRYLTPEEVTKGFTQIAIPKQEDQTEQAGKFKTELEAYRFSSRSGKDEWANPTNAGARKRNRTQHAEDSRTGHKKDSRTLRELREDLNSLLFDVSSVNLRSQTSRLGKGTPLVIN
ncbi:hypothetical protein P7C70_g8101, partial [Phenoliferia sp. Uapishka_3]